MFVDESILRLERFMRSRLETSGNSNDIWPIRQTAAYRLVQWFSAQLSIGPMQQKSRIFPCAKEVTHSSPILQPVYPEVEMHILVVDTQELLSNKQVLRAEDRLFFCLMRFNNRIDGVTLHFSSDIEQSELRCAIHVSLDGSKVVSVRRAGSTFDEAMTAAIAALEPGVARRLHWRSWFDVRTVTHWIYPVNRWLKQSLGFGRRNSADTSPSDPQRQKTRSMGNIPSSKPRFGWSKQQSDTFST